MNKGLFQKIIDREIPAEIVYETEQVLAFKDVNPQAPVHVLVIPKKPIAKLSDAEDEDHHLLGELLHSAKIVASEMQLDEGGYRVVINNGENACQTVFHLHLHILGGRGFSWPPG